MLLGAPTGSGKTVAAELAIFRVFNEYPSAKVCVVVLCCLAMRYAALCYDFMWCDVLFCNAFYAVLKTNIRKYQKPGKPLHIPQYAMGNKQRVEFHSTFSSLLARNSVLSPFSGLLKISFDHFQFVRTVPIKSANFPFISEHFRGIFTVSHSKALHN